MNDTTARIIALTERVAALEQRGAFDAGSASTWWLLSNGILVFFMQCGFGMLEAGSVTARGTHNILLKNLLDASISAVVWYSVGFGLAFDGDNAFIGVAGLPSTSGDRSPVLFFGVKMLEEDAAGFSTANSVTGYDWAFWWFQFTFAATAATIVSGAVAERAQLVSYLVYSTVITLFIYPVVVHWVWSDSGWLSLANPQALLGGVIDFAGAGVVHVTGGISALCGAFVIGPRRGRFVSLEDADALARSRDDQRRCFCASVCNTRPSLPMPGHSTVLQALGTFILWMGWYGFNAGSTLAISGSHTATAARIFATTTLSASFGGIVAVVLERVYGASQRWSVTQMCNGVLAGLVSITAGCATCPAWSAVVIGCGGGAIFHVTSWLVLERLHIDDPLDAFAVHGAAGMWAVLACSIFSSDYYVLAVTGRNDGGLVYGSARLLGAAAVFLTATITWVAVASLSMFMLLRRLGVLRTSAGPSEGADSSSHHGAFPGGIAWGPPASSSPPPSSGSSTVTSSSASSRRPLDAAASNGGKGVARLVAPCHATQTT